MYYVYTVFDRSNIYKPIPLAMGISSDNSEEINFIPLYVKGTSTTIYDVNKRIVKISKLLSSNDAFVNDSKLHMESFGVKNEHKMLSYEYNHCSVENNVDVIGSIISENMKNVKKLKFHKRYKLLSDAHDAYLHLQNIGYSNGLHILHPYYSTDTFTGRSKTVVNNIQGCSADDLVYPSNESHQCFVHFDWISADIRTGCVLSNDERMNDDFVDSDPYAVLSKNVSMSRDDCKKSFLSSIYSLNPHESFIQYYEKFHKWMLSCINNLERWGCLYSILGKRYDVSDKRSKESVFNAMIQGSVAHGMQNVLRKVCNIFPDNVLTEIHDSIILTCDKTTLKTIVDEVSKIMLHPFDGLIEENPRFPLIVSVGNKWKKWQKIKVMR